MGVFRSGSRMSSRVSVVAALAVPAALLVQVGVLPAAQAAQAPVGAGFAVTTGDLSFILKQIKIAERHAATLDASHPCSTLLNKAGDGIPDAEQVPDVLTAYGLRTVDGTCNNLKAGDETLGAADKPFPRMTTAKFRDAEPITPSFPVGAPGPTSYKQKSGSVVDSGPRLVSNLIVDQTSTNPAAVSAAGHPVRTQGAGASAVPCTTDPDPLADPPVAAVPVNCTPTHQTLFIPNVTTDVGLSPPYNDMFTFFGQFFDHGIDQTVKGGGTVFVPLKADDPLIAGPDHKTGTSDDVPASQRFMVLTRAKNQPGPDGVLGTADDVQNANNTDTPWIDQSQTYSSHASHQVFLRTYRIGAAAPDATNPAAVPTGKLLGGLPAGQTYAGSPDGTDGLSTWAAVKKQARELLGLRLTDADALDVPMLATDPYGKFVPGPHGLPQYVTKTGMVEGDLANPVAVPADVLHFDTPFLTDIAHNADPSPQDTDHNPRTAPVAPAPDSDTSPSADFANQAPGTYDDEMLDSHFACGDGRCNENIALSAIHQVFHSEHDRLVDDIDKTLTSDTSATGVATLAAWKATGVSGYGYGERLFQAARYVAEMEYQHLVFEEFARKVQPAVRPFRVYSPDVDPSVQAEFAHAVYRFGHSMLNDTVGRTNVSETGAKSDNSVQLLDGFLNPPEYFNGRSAGTLTPQQAAGSIVMGSSDQVGNELDEFVTETLRNNLLGLPLDLATLNIARARETGVPTLNELRREIHDTTNDGQLAPYTSWADLGQHLKHPESLVNFVAAYGTHPTVTAATTAAAKRDAARAIVNPAQDDVVPDDAADFMFSNAAWSSQATGLDDVDLWVGGLAEVTNINGGLLGSTFNYVFQTQLENLQDGDRLYYLVRTPGANLRAQLEGNSFSEMIQRNTDGTNSLKADAFATADCRFQLANLNGTPAGFSASGSSVADDPSTECSENALLRRLPDGTIQYRSTNTVDPAGINGQAVYNGTAGVDRVYAGNDNDTFWGGAGNDVLEGAAGDDVAIGGEGNDVLTDLGGDDIPKGGPGNDAIDGGPGLDILHGNTGKDFLNGGANDNETFAGEGDDFTIGGLGADVVFGDGGDDWIQGGTGQDLLQGDHGAPFFDDPAENRPGNDVMVGQAGENDYDAEGGDDIMAQNAAVDRNAGAGGFDWATHQYDTVGADDDMDVNNFADGVPIQVVVNRDRWQETEANSGSRLDDVIKGQNSVPATVGEAGFTGCNVLDQAGVDRISGLAAILPQPLTGDPAPVVAGSAAGTCPTTGPIWGEGDILIGGEGSDSLTGRGADDVIDGDRSLKVRISVRTIPADAKTEIGSTDLMEGKAVTGSFGPGTTGMTLQAAVFAGLVDTGNLVAVREIVSPTVPAPDCAAVKPVNCDTAVFLGPRSNYGFEGVGDHLVVTQTGADVAGQKASDGVDTLRNIERLRFSDSTVTIATPAAPAIGTATAGDGSANVRWTAPVSNGGPDVSGYEVIATPTTGGAVVTQTGISALESSAQVTGLRNGTTYTLQVRALNDFGAGAPSAASNPVTPSAPAPPPATAPSVPTGVTGVRGNAQVSLSWTVAGNGGSAVTSSQIQVYAGTTLRQTITVTGAATTTVVTGLTNGTAYSFRVRATNAVGSSAYSAASAAVTPGAPVTVPGTPAIGTATAGTAGGAVTATANWPAATNTGGSAITGYVVRALRINAAGTVVSTTTSARQPATARRLAMTLPAAGNYRFTVQAVNAVGASAQSARSNLVAGR